MLVKTLVTVADVEVLRYVLGVMELLGRLVLLEEIVETVDVVEAEPLLVVVADDSVLLPDSGLL